MLGIVVMTALPPTEGHLGLIRFAGDFVRRCDGELLVLMCVLPDEPPGRAEHRDALWSALSRAERSKVRIEIQFSNDPQGPKGPDDDEFWAHWVQTVTRQTSGRAPTHVFSSEGYGPRLAAALGAQHVPYDAARSGTMVSGTMVRRHLVQQFPRIVRPLRDSLRRRIVIFGQESTGKTTLARILAIRTGSAWCPEWARPYLEALPTPEITQERMLDIVRGQYAAEDTTLAASRDVGCPFLFQDTDLMSTLGYQLHWCRGRSKSRDIRPGYVSSWGDSSGAERDLNEVWQEIQDVYTPPDLYIVMSDRAAFVPDPLRYGGDRRETDRQFWIDLLEERDLPHYVMEKACGESGWEDEALEVSVACLERRAGFAGFERRR